MAIHPSASNNFSWEQYEADEPSIRDALVSAEHSGPHPTQDRESGATGCNSDSKLPTRNLCPWTDCGQWFKLRKDLVRHFDTHVKCKEWCLLCGKFLTTVSTFIRHARMHDQEEATTRKRSYIAGTCNNLR
ncbi:hypothetical protein F4824DRAFT_34545 [Ustulina deusta]|nr:hypothetical protein F4824DRAFT_34545 [Ustulina deusta]